MSVQVQIPKNNEIYKMLKAVFALPIVVLVLGDWRTGKTNNSLLIAYWAKIWGLIDKIGTNIITQGKNASMVELIEETGKLKNWLHKDNSEKLYIFDEGLKSMYRRKAMSKLSVKFISEIMPEISKGHCRILFLTQIDSIDADLIHPAFMRAKWKCLEKGVMECQSKHYPRRVLEDLPKSPIDYDPDKLARFIDKEMYNLPDNSQAKTILDIAEYYVNGLTYGKIANKLGIHKQQVKRHIQKLMKWAIDNYEEPKTTLEN